MGWLQVEIQSQLHKGSSVRWRGTGPRRRPMPAVSAGDLGEGPCARLRVCEGEVRATAPRTVPSLQPALQTHWLFLPLLPLLVAKCP